jgi:hypothetical protein
MKKGTLDNIKAFGCLIPLILLTSITDSIPWWSFVVAVGLFGTIITVRKWKVAGFSTGFLAGLVVWTGANMYFHITLEGDVFEKIGQVLSVPGPVVIVISGVTGGLLTGLALYTGQSVVYQREASV